MEGTSLEENRSGDNRQAEAAKVFVKDEAGHIIKKRAHLNKGNGVAEGEAVLSPQVPKNPLGLGTNDITVSHNRQPKLHFVEKR